MAGRRTPSPGRQAAAFTIRFVALVLLLSAAVRVDLVLLDGAGSRLLTHASASAVTWVFTMAGENARRIGNSIYFHGAAFRIIDECTGVEVMGLFAAAVLAFPSSGRRRLRGLATGLPALALLNLVRMVTLVWIGSVYPAALETGHVYVWPMIILTTALGLWLHWARIAVRGPSPLV